MVSKADSATPRTTRLNRLQSPTLTTNNRMWYLFRLPCMHACFAGPFPIPDLQLVRVRVHKAGGNGSCLRGQNMTLVATKLFYHKMNCGFQYVFQFCTFFLPLRASLHGRNWLRGLWTRVNGTCVDEKHLRITNKISLSGMKLVLVIGPIDIFMCLGVW